MCDRAGEPNWLGPTTASRSLEFTPSAPITKSASVFHPSAKLSCTTLPSCFTSASRLPNAIATGSNSFQDRRMQIVAVNGDVAGAVLSLAGVAKR